MTCFCVASAPSDQCVYTNFLHCEVQVVEPRESALFPEAAEQFKAKLADKSYCGAVFFAVCRCA